MKKLVLFILGLYFAVSVPYTIQAQVSGQSAPVKLDIRKRKIPPILSVEDIRFEDENGNNRIDGLEACKILFTIKNSGNGPASGMTMSVTERTSLQGLEFSRQTSVNTILPGGKSLIAIPVKATINLTDGTALFAFSFDEPLGFPPDPFEMKIDAKAFLNPDVKIADHNFQTDDGVVKTGMPIRLITLIQNQGQGIAEKVTITYNYPQRNVFPNGDEIFELGNLNPGDSREVVFEFLPNKLYTDPSIPIQVSIVEKHGRYGEKKSVSATIDARTDNRTIAITSTANDGRVTITPVSLTADVDKNIPETSINNPHSYALIIGNEDYTTYQRGLSSESNVPFAVSDARTFEIYANKTLGIPVSNIVTITNAISSVMARELEKLVKTIQYENGQSEIFLFYAGHGFPDEATGESFLMPVDISGADVNRGIPLKKLYADLTRYASRRVTVFLDACFSGGGREAGLLAARAVRIKPKEDPVTGNLVIFAASSGDQSALPYQDQKHGMFTYFLLKTIQEAKGDLTYRELFDQTKRQVELTAVRINGKDQNPTLIYSPELGNTWEGWKLTE